MGALLGDMGTYGRAGSSFNSTQRSVLVCCMVLKGVEYAVTQLIVFLFQETAQSLVVAGVVRIHRLLLYAYVL